MHELTKKELERIYLYNTNDKACEILGVTKVTLLKYVRAAGIKTKGKGNCVGVNCKKIRILE